MSDYNGKNVWIIGASSGIGRALAHELYKQGATLILSARREDELRALNHELGGEHYVHAFDVGDLTGFLSGAKHVAERVERLDHVVFLAAIYDPAPLCDMDIEKAHQMVQVNIGGAFNLIHAVLPILKAQKSGQMVLCGSVAGYRGLPNGQPYSATKAAVINLAESLRAEERALDIKVINPGFVRTPLTDKNDFKMPMMIEPEDAAKAIAEGMMSKRFEIHFPKRFTYIMKIIRLLPSFMYFKIFKSS